MKPHEWDSMESVFTVGQKKLMKVPQLALDRSQCEASPGGTSQQISDRIVVDAKSTGASTRSPPASDVLEKCAISRHRLAGQLALSGSLQHDHFAFVNHHIRLGIMRLSTLVSV